MTLPRKTTSIPDIVGGGYGDFWAFRGRYRVCKGSRASKKSKTTALNFIVRLMQYPDANLLVVRKVFRTLKDSCYTDLKWAMRRLGVEMWWDCKESPLEMTYRPTGQKILFRGLDDPMKITSITVERGSLCWMWIEEAYEVGSEADFNMLDESIRGHVEPPLFKQVTLTFNPWSGRHWLKARFFDCRPSPDVLAKTTNYTCNEFLDEADRLMFGSMKLRDPTRYRVAGLGDWGVVEGLAFENVTLAAISDEDIKGFERACHGLDWGYYPDPTAYVRCHYEHGLRKLYIYGEAILYRASSHDVYERLVAEGVQPDDTLICDNSDKRSIADLRAYGLDRALAASKKPGSRNYSMKWLQGLSEIVIDERRCPTAAREFSDFSYAKAPDGSLIDQFQDGNDHCIDAVRYATNMIWREAGE